MPASFGKRCYITPITFVGLPRVFRTDLLPGIPELDTAKFASGYATGYDALYSVLSEADRKTIADAMVRLGVLRDFLTIGCCRPAHGFIRWIRWGTIGGVFVSQGLEFAALALLGDDLRAQGWIDAVDAGFEQWFNYRGNVLQNLSGRI